MVYVLLVHTIYLVTKPNQTTIHFVGGRRVTTLLKSLSTDNFLSDPGGGCARGWNERRRGGNLPIVPGNSSALYESNNTKKAKQPLTCPVGRWAHDRGFFWKTNETLELLFWNLL